MKKMTWPLITSLLTSLMLPLELACARPVQHAPEITPDGFPSGIHNITLSNIQSEKNLDTKVGSERNWQFLFPKAHEIPSGAGPIVLILFVLASFLMAKICPQDARWLRKIYSKEALAA